MRAGLLLKAAVQVCSLCTVLPCSFCYIEITLNNSLCMSAGQCILFHKSFVHVTLGLAYKTGLLAYSVEDFMTCLVQQPELHMSLNILE